MTAKVVVGKNGKVSIGFRVSEEMARKFEEHMSNLHLNRNEVVNLILAKYLSEQGVNSDGSGQATNQTNQ